MLRWVRYIVSLLIIATVVVFSVVNREKTGIDLYPMPFLLEAPKFLLILLPFGLGVILGIMQGSLMLHRQRREVKRLQAREDALNSEVASLRNESANTALALPEPYAEPSKAA